MKPTVGVGVQGGDPRADSDGATTLPNQDALQDSTSLDLELLVVESRGIAVHALARLGSVRFGRARECDVRLDDAMVSRLHATLHLPSLTIRDHGSANGTLLNNKRIAPEVPVGLDVGQVMRIGAAFLIVRPASSERKRPRETPPNASKDIVIREPCMQELHSLAKRLALGSIGVLILGETGTGKEVLAEAIHRMSARRQGPFIRINCASFVEPLLESELFGHERGAFTGAVSTKPGLIELASGGTIFLDEVGDLPVALQPRLLRVIESHQALRIGGVKPRAVDVRFISATNRDLRRDIERGCFRSDLFFRLSGASLRVPPLRERRLEIVPLAEFFAERFAEQLHWARPPRFSPAALERLQAHTWPGNVRELQNAVHRALLLMTGESVLAEHLELEEGWQAAPSPPEVVESITLRPLGVSGAIAGEVATSPATDSERQRILGALSLHGGNQSRAAKSLGVSRRTLVRTIARLGLPRPRA